MSGEVVLLPSFECHSKGVVVGVRIDFLSRCSLHLHLFSRMWRNHLSTLSQHAASLGVKIWKSEGGGLLD